MKKVIQLLILSLIIGVSSAQTYQNRPEYGWRFKNIVVDSTLNLPFDTVLRSNLGRLGAIVYQQSDNTVYIKKPGRWEKVASGFGVALDSAAYNASTGSWIFRRTNVSNIIVPTGIPDSLLKRALLDGSGKLYMSQIPASLLGAVNYQGGYNAATNSPSLPAAAAGNKGYYWVVSTPGTQFGLTLAVGDWIISNGSVYQKVDNNNAVTSVAGRTGAVVIDTGDITNFSQKVRTRVSASGSGLAYNAATGAFTNTGAPASGGSGYIWAQTATGQSAGFNITGSGYIGNMLGVGVTDPLYKVDVGGGYMNIRDAVSGDHFGYLLSNNQNQQRWLINLANPETTGAGSDFRIMKYNDAGTVASDVLSISRNNSVLTMLSPRVLINTTTDNTFDALQVNGSFRAGPGLIVGTPSDALSQFLTIRNSANTQSANVQLQADGSLGVMVYNNGTGTYTEKMRITPAGNLGVGTTSPATKLEVNGSATISGVLHTSGGGSPEGVVTAPVGSWYSDTTNGLPYFKKTGTGNTGWKQITLNP